jgi:hypothetical protein
MTVAYFDHIKAAILDLKQRRGSSQEAISKVVGVKRGTCSVLCLNRALNKGVNQVTE